MSERETNVFLAKLAEQAERYEGKRTVFCPHRRHFVLLLLESSVCDHIKSVTLEKPSKTFFQQTLLEFRFAHIVLLNGSHTFYEIELFTFH